MILGVIRFASPRIRAGLNWINLALGAWVATSLWIYGYINDARLWNNLIVGIAVLVLAIWSGSATTAEHRAGPTT